jgi:hypothetical protein
MPIRPIILERTLIRDDAVTINPSGLYFGAKFMRNNNLQKMLSVSFLQDDEDSYWLGFVFKEEEGADNSLSLLRTTRSHTSAGRSLKAMELFTRMPILQEICKNSLRKDRIFEPRFNKEFGCYYILLRPSFELKVKADNDKNIPSGAKGIYQYLDSNGEIIYIGKGVIKERLRAKRGDWGIVEIQYSIMSNDDDAFKWEGYYLDKFKIHTGRLPHFNRINGHHSNDHIVN